MRLLSPEAAELYAPRERLLPVEDPEGRFETAAQGIFLEALDVAAGLGYLWVSSSEGTVTRFDPTSGIQVGKPIELGPQPQAIAIGEGALWVASAKGQAVFRVTP